MTLSGEKACSYQQGGDEIIVGFIKDVARYMAVVRRRGPLVRFSPAELASILSLNASPSLWKKEIQEIGSAPAKSSKTSSKRIPASRPPSILGWQPGDKPFVFFFLPAWPDQPPILLNEWQVSKAIS